MITLVLALLLTAPQFPQRSETHDLQELRIFQTIELVHELMPPHSSRRLKNDYWKAVACYYKFQADQVPDCEVQLDRVEHDLQVK
jgi:hypothetical protein